jgi:predicted ATPase/class 3 adenylate cyclase
MNNLPSGTVTFLFTDIEDSTTLWEEFPEAMKSALAKHDSILKETIESNHGHIIKTTGDGVHAVFTTAIDAINAAIESQRKLNSLILDSQLPITPSQSPISTLSLKSRMGLHTGEAELRDGDYFGQTLNRAVRIMSAGHGGQILISDITAEVAREHLPGDVFALDLGDHVLKGLLHPERIHQLVASGLQREFPALHTTPSATNNLPPQLTSFIGRERELTEAARRLEYARLLTLIGPGGTGKTRLSIQISAEQLANFKNGVWLVELAPISDPAFIIPAIASVFEIREVQNIPLIQLVLDYLRAKELLLVLDNCEHLVEASAQVADQLLHECPHLKIIASSREALGVNGETIYRVPPLKDDEATRLFIERATKAEPRFHLTDENASFVAQICSRLDGIPLAIELAAARVKLFTPEQIAARLDDRFKLLTGGVRTALPRQQTLRALIDWSYHLLNETEQRALRGLAVFSGGWTIEAAESVLGEADALDGLQGLVNKSLVIVDEQEGKSRYRYLETIRQYAMEKLVESGDAVEMRDRHLDYMLAFTGPDSLPMFGAEEPGFLDRFEEEHDNLRAALDWATGNNLPKALKLAFAAGGYWSVRDFNSEALYRCNTILEKTSDLADAGRDRARLYSLLGWVSVTLGEHKAGRLASEQAIDLGLKNNDASIVARSYATLALICIFLGDYASAYRAAEEGERIAREHGFEAELAFVLSTRAQMEYFSRSNLEQAKDYLHEAAYLAKKAGFGWASSFMAIGLGNTAAIVGDMDAARAAFEESAALAQKIGNKRIIYSSQSEFAHILRKSGELDEPLATYRDLLPKWRDLGHRSAVAHELECIAFILVRKEEPERAVALLGAADALRKRIDSVMTNAEQIEYGKEVSSVREMLGDEKFREGWEAGGKLSMDEAIDLALV